MSNTITIKDSKGNVVCSVESTVPVQHSSDLFAIVEEAQKTIESYRLECAKYANTLQVMSTESFGENVKNIATKFLQKVKQFFQKVALWCKNTYGKIIISRIKNENMKSVLNNINDCLYLIAKDYYSIDQKELNLVEGYEERINRLISLTSKTMNCLQRAAFLCIKLEKDSKSSDVFKLFQISVKCLSVTELRYIQVNAVSVDDEDMLEKTFNSVEGKIDEMNNFVSSKLKEITEEVKNK